MFLVKVILFSSRYLMMDIGGRRFIPILHYYLVVVLLMITWHMGSEYDSFIPIQCIPPCCY